MLVRCSLKLFCLAFLMVSLLAPGQCQRTKETHMLPMRDGVTHLATDVYFPSREGVYPTILSRTPYSKDADGMDAWGRSVANSGFIVVLQDIRGRYASEGDFMLFHDDAWGENQDAYDTLEWIVSQPWSDGQVCTWGGSALAITQYMLLGADHPSLVCTIPLSGTGNMYQDASYTGGAFRKSLMETWLIALGEEDVLKVVKDHASFDFWWDDIDLANRYSEVNNSSFHVGGWYDIFTQGTIDAFKGLNENSEYGALGMQKLVIGPYTHGTFYQSTQGQLVYPENATSFRQGDFTTDFLNYWLKDIDNGIMDEATVAYYLMGDVDDSEAPGNEWRYVDTWPPQSFMTPFYFLADGSLSTNAPMSAGYSEFTFDPSNPVPTNGGNNLVIPAGPYDQREQEARSDVLTFTSETLTEPLEISGRVMAKLFVSSDAKDTDFTVKLTDVYPDGRSMLVMDGIIRMRYREGFDKEVLMQAGTVYEADVDLWSTAIVFNVGHKLRVSVSSSNYPKWDVNPNTGEAQGGSSPMQTAQQKVYHTPQQASYILLPIISQQ